MRGNVEIGKYLDISMVTKIHMAIGTWKCTVDKIIIINDTQYSQLYKKKDFFAKILKLPFLN